MKKIYAGKWTLALTFILLGTSILWNMYGTIKIPIADFYPVVLVFLGLELIFKTLTRNGKKVSLEGGSIILLLVIMIFVNVIPFTFFGPRSNDLFSDEHPVGEFLRDLSQGNVAINFDGIGRFNTTYEIEEKFSSESFNALNLQNVFGDIILEPWEQDDIKVLIQVQSNNEDEAYVEGLKDELLSSEFHSDGTLELTSNNRRYLEDSRVKSLRMNYHIFFPKGESLTSLKITNEFGDVSIMEIESALSVINRHGDVKIVDNGEKVQVENHFGDVTLGSLSGEVEINNRHGDVTLENEEEVLRGLAIENEFGSVYLQLSQDQWGIFDLHTRFGDINQDIGSFEEGFEEERGSNEVTFKGSLGEGEARIFVNNRHGDINIDLN